jgi:glycopeptide antibiotics resistance protein
VYNFDEGMGDIVRNHAQFATDLRIPSQYVILHEALLVAPWNEFYTSWGYWRSVVINIAGFIPLGFCVYAYFSEGRQLRHAALIAICGGFAVSAGIEVLQAFLPTRESGVTDIITNTFGTWIGVMLGKANLQNIARSLRRLTSGADPNSLIMR